MADPMNDDLVGRLEKARADHLRLASWNRGRDRPERAAYHYDTAGALHAAIKRLRPTAGTGSHEGEGG